jgi:hypothetical protein
MAMLSGHVRYSANNKVGGNYYAQRKKMRGRRKLNPRPRLWYHARRPSSASPTIKLRWYGRGEGASYAIVQQLRYFHKSQEPKMITELKPFLFSLETHLLALLHQFTKIRSRLPNTHIRKPNGANTWNQNSWLKTHEVRICCIVSSSWLQRTQCSSFCRPRFFQMIWCPTSILSNQPEENFALRWSPSFPNKMPRFKSDGSLK